MQLTIRLPANRELGGTLTLTDSYGTLTDSYGSELAGPFVCRGKADNGAAAQAGNPSRDPLKPFGDTPLGDYEPAKFIHLPPPAGHMGLIVIPLVGISGQALQALQNGRKGLFIHGGRGNAADSNSSPPLPIVTDGCVRLYDNDIAALFEAMTDLPANITIEPL